MKHLKNLFSLSVTMAMLSTPLCAQNDQYMESSQAYDDGMQASYMSAVIPLTALVVAGVLIASTDRHHHHSGSGSYSGSSHHHCHSHN